MHSQQLPADASGDACGTANQGLSSSDSGDADHDPFAGLPRVGDAMGVEVAVQRLFDAVRQPQQGELSESRQVARTEVVAHRRVDSLGRVDVAVRQTPTDRFGCHVDQFELIGVADDLVGDRLALSRAGDAGDDVVQRFEVLDVHGRDHVDAGVEQLFDVLPPLLVLRSRSVGVRVLVDENDLRASRQDGIEIQLLQNGAAILDLPQWDDLQVADLSCGLVATVRFDDADHHIGAALLAAHTFTEHPVRLADARRCAEVDAQRSPCHGASPSRLPASCSSR